MDSVEAKVLDLQNLKAFCNSMQNNFNSKIFWFWVLQNFSNLKCYFTTNETAYFEIIKKKKLLSLETYKICRNVTCCCLLSTAMSFSVLIHLEVASNSNFCHFEVGKICSTLKSSNLLVQGLHLPSNFVRLIYRGLQSKA